NNVAGIKPRRSDLLPVEKSSVGAVVVGKIKTVRLRLDKRVLFRSDPFHFPIEFYAARFASPDRQKAFVQLENPPGKRSALDRQRKIHAQMIPDVIAGRKTARMERGRPRPQRLRSNLNRASYIYSDFFERFRVHCGRGRPR